MYTFNKKALAVALTATIGSVIAIPVHASVSATSVVEMSNFVIKDSSWYCNR